MQDLKNLKERLAREESALVAIHEEAEAVVLGMEDARRQIEAGEAKIEELRERGVAAEKRMTLLRQYIEMVESGEEDAGALEAATSASGDGAAVLDALPDMEMEDAMDAEEQVYSLDMTPPVPVTTHAAADVAEDETLSFETIDEKRLSVEVLPRAQSFVEELLLLMAHHRKAIKPNDMAKTFRRWDYAPQGPATAKGIKDQLDADHHFFEHVADGRYALTPEGRTEADKLLQQM